MKNSLAKINSNELSEQDLGQKKKDLSNWFVRQVVTHYSLLF